MPAFTVESRAQAIAPADRRVPWLSWLRSMQSILATTLSGSQDPPLYEWVLAGETHEFVDVDAVVCSADRDAS
jgi:hypothetical protein